MMIETITRLLAAWRTRRWRTIRRRRAERRAREARRRADAEAYEAAHWPDRVSLGLDLLARVPEFSRTERGRWACRTYGRWPIVADLAVDRNGALWRLGERHWFGSIPDKRLETAEALAANFSTATLRAAVRFIEPRAFWLQALQEEVLHHLGFRGRPV